MKKLILIPISFLLLLFSACDEGIKENVATEEKTKDLSKSEIYNEIITRNSGDFIGVAIGMTLNEVKAFFDSENLSEEAEDFLQYKISETYTISDYSFIFEDDKLNQIAFDSKVYDSADNPDPEAAQVLFNDLMSNFLDKFGSKYLETNNENSSILFWTSEDKEIQLIKDYSEVHVYIDVIQE